MKNVKRTQGFTLIELLIVIAIIGILAAVLIPNLLGAQKRAYDAGAQSCAKGLQTVQATAQIDAQTYSAVTAIKPVTDGVPTQCTDANMSVVEVTPPTASAYSISIGDIRGSYTYTITPSKLSKVAGAPAAGAPIK